MIFLFCRDLRDFLRIAVMGNLHTEVVQAEEISVLLNVNQSKKWAVDVP